MEEIRIYTDGGCSGNPGPGGWAYVILKGPEEHPGSGGEKETTNNRMELMAVISALEGVSAAAGPDGSEKIRIYTDSQYVKNGINQWIKTWVKNGWKTSAGKSVKNRDLWERLFVLQNRLVPAWEWVKGHSGDHYNEFCDSLVQKEIARFRG